MRPPLPDRLLSQPAENVMNVFKYSDVIDEFCWCITKLLLRELIVVYIVIHHEFYYQFLKPMWFGTLKRALRELGLYSNYMVQLIFYQKLGIVYSMFSSLVNIKIFRNIF